MNIFFTTPFAGKANYQQEIDAIVAAIEDNNRVITPENTQKYTATLSSLQDQGLNKEQAHYAFIRQGIASADAVIIEATEEDIRVGHELTLALLFHKPTLVLSQKNDFSKYITHDLLQGALYKTERDAELIVKRFIETALAGRPESTMQTIDMSADSLHAVALAKLRQLSRQEPGQFGEWARQAEVDPQKVADDIANKLGSLKPQPAWSVFAPIYNEDSPDSIQAGVARFVTDVLRENGFRNLDTLIEAACGTAALSRQLVARGIRKIKAFDNSRPMIAEAFRLSTDYPSISLFESDITELALPEKAKAIVWTDYSSNFSLDESQLKAMLANLMHNLTNDGTLILDIRTLTGWQIDFYAQPITTFATERFQRIWLNKQDHESHLIYFDIYIRVRDVDGAWSEWRRESMTERMWTLKEVMKTISKIPGVSVQKVYGDDFRKIDFEKEEPGLAYIVLRQAKS